MSQCRDISEQHKQVTESIREGGSEFIFHPRKTWRASRWISWLCEWLFNILSAGAWAQNSYFKELLCQTWPPLMYLSQETMPNPGGPSRTDSAFLPLALLNFYAAFNEISSWPHTTPRLLLEATPRPASCVTLLWVPVLEERGETVWLSRCPPAKSNSPGTPAIAWHKAIPSLPPRNGHDQRAENCLKV